VVTVHGAPGGQEDYKQWGTARFLKGIAYDPAITTPVSFSFQYDNFRLGLDRPEAC